MKDNNNYTGMEIAVIGMAGRFPGAGHIHQFWENLKNSVESVTFFNEKELNNIGIGTRELTGTHFVNSSGGLLEEKAKMFFDASFFSYTPLEAEIMDPQLRIFHECSWEALENAGYVPDLYEGLIGLYAGASPHIYWQILAVASGKSEALGDFAASQLADKDSLSMKVSYKLDLRGPAVTVQTTCSTSLVAIHMACQALLNGECSMALAGGVSARYHVNRGYFYQEGMISSVDGHCRAFDANAKGTTSGEGVAVVVLKPLDNAGADRDNIYAIIKGSAVNNDGIRKIGYTAPSIAGQEAVIRMAHQVAEVEPESISYIEAHGTGTPLGDPIEIQALIRAFDTDKKKYCAIGSVKTNIGHLDSAAGAASLIKTVLALKHRLIPPSLHFETPNPEIDFDNSPFYINTEPKEWNNHRCPLRAGVSSFGIGGTNAHVVLEEAPGAQRADGNNSPAGRRPGEYHLILLSAKTPPALERMTENLEEYFKTYLANQGNHDNPVNTALFLADAAYTLQVGRKAFDRRRMMVVPDMSTAVKILSSQDSSKVKTFFTKENDPPVVFMFSGLGGQYVDMGRELYEKEPIFREEIDRCFKILRPLIDYDIKEILYPGKNKGPLATGNAQPAASSKKIYQTVIAQPLVFALEYALTKLLMHRGIKPYAMIGYSFGEYAAACISGVFSLEAALKLVVNRGQLISYTSNGAMMSVPLTAEELEPQLNHEVCISIDNGPSCIVSGSPAAIDALEKRLKAQKYLCMRLETDKAIHSSLMDPILSAFQSKVSQVTLNKPGIPYISNVTADWVTPGQAMDPGYWSDHLRKTVRYAEGVKKLLAGPASIFIEIGPGRDLCSLIQRHLSNSKDSPSRHFVLDMIRPRQKEISDVYYFLNQIGRIWLYGKAIDWPLFYTNEERRRVALPSYPFEGRRYSIDGDLLKFGTEFLSRNSFVNKKTDMADWFYMPLWEQTIPWPGQLTEIIETGAPLNWLLFIDESHFTLRLCQQLVQEGQRVTTVKTGPEFTETGKGEYWVNPLRTNDYDTLFGKLRQLNSPPDIILHCWNLSTPNNNDSDRNNEITFATIQHQQEVGFYSLLNIVQAMSRQGAPGKVHIHVVTDGMQEVTGEERLCPGKATILGAVKAIPLEYHNIGCTSIDVVLPGPGTGREDRLIAQLLAEFTADTPNNVVAFRGNHRWIPAFKPLNLNNRSPRANHLPFKEKGVYLITGGSGGIGFAFAQYLAKIVNAKLILLGRSVFPLEKKQKIRELEKAGAEIMIANADVANEQQVQTVVTKAKERFGPINGVIHAAGIADYSGVIQKRTMQKTGDILAAKVTGTLVLDSILKAHPLDFFVICSSLSSMITPFAQVGYCAANFFVDAFAHYKMLEGGPLTVAINWDLWQEVGMGVKAIKAFEKEKHLPISHEPGVEIGILPSEGTEVLRRILHMENSRPLAQIAVSTRDLNILLEHRLRPEEEFSHLIETLGESAAPGTLEQRPHLSSQYTAPSTEIESRLAAIWQKSFGIREIGIHDDFFEMGGDSLMAIVVTAKIHKGLEVGIPLAEFFNRPTIRQLSAYIADTQHLRCESVTPVEIKDYYPLSSAQKRLYILQQIEEGSTPYNITGATKLGGDLHIRRLRDSFRKLIRRHESLRTAFIVVNGEPVQKIQDDVEFEFQYREIPGERAMVGEQDPENPGQKNHMAKTLIKNFVRPFDLTKAPLFRVKIARLSAANHILMYEMHHIISDMTSMHLLIRQLKQLYQGDELPKLHIQYKDYCDWQKNLFKTAAYLQQEEYWLSVFKGEIPLLALHYDYPRPAVQNFEGGSIFFETSAEIYEGISRIASNTGTTLYMILLAAYNVLLGKYTGQEDIIVGSPIAGRHHGDLQNIIGMFVNTLALRNYPVGNMLFTQFLENLKKNTIKAYENQDYPFEELIHHLNLKRDLSRNPLFDTMFVWQNIGNREMKTETTGLKFKPCQFESTVAKFDLTIEAAERHGKIGFYLEYCSKLFKKKTIQRLVNHFIVIFQRIISNPAIKLADIDILSDEERQQILVDFNNNKSGFSRDKTIYQLFEQHAQNTPDHKAIVFDHHQFTYRQLNERANRLARYLLKNGVREDHTVGIGLGRSTWMVESILAVWKACGAYIPVDPGYPHSRVITILQDSGTRVLISDSEFIDPELEKSFEGIIIDLENLKFDYTASDMVNPGLKINMNSLAYVIYTSGSTGNPKGVMIDHIGMMNHIGAKINDLCLSCKSIVGQNASHTFDISVWQFFVSLVVGGRTVIYSNELILEPGRFIQQLIKDHVTVLEVVPSYLSLLLDTVGEERPVSLSLEYLLVTGEEVKPYQVEQWFKRYTRIKMVNAYGPTEASDDITHYIMSKAPEGHRIPIGKSLQNFNIYIVQGDMNLCPIGVKGEICVAGVGVGRGYLNNPELTYENFLLEMSDKDHMQPCSHEAMKLSPHPPITPLPHHPIYLTGDLARWLQDGSIEFLGRIDHQVKIRGFRIELGEIESQLLTYESIKEAVVVDRKDENNPNNTYLCAYLVTNKKIGADSDNHAPFTISQLRTYLSGRLPEYMVPSYYIQLKKIPLTPNGKVDRNALPLTGTGNNLDTGSPYSPPQNEREKQLAEIWTGILFTGNGSPPPIGRDDNFFHLGGNSLRATTLIHRIHQVMNVLVPFREVFKNQTLQQLARYLRETDKNLYLSIKPVEEKVYHHVSSAQKRLFLLQQYEGVEASYNIPCAVIIEGSLDKKRLEETFKTLVKRHEGLRTSFEVIAGEPMQKVHPAYEVRPEIHVLTSRGKGEFPKQKEVKEIIRSFIRPFELSEAPLIRVGLMVLEDAKHILVCDMHHIISDGVSITILVKEFAHSYTGRDLPELRIQYKDFSAWQNQLFETDKVKKQEAYWLSQFPGEIPVLNLPTDSPRPTVRSFEGDSITFAAGIEISKGLNQLTTKTKSTLFMVLLAAYTVLLAKYTGQEDIIVGSPTAGRLHADLENIIGMFLNTLAIRNFPTGNKSFRQFLEEVKESTLQAFENQDYQFEKLVEKLDITLEPGRNPLFDTMFILQNLDAQDVNIGDIRFRPYEIESMNAKFDLMIEVYPTLQGTLLFCMSYCSKIFKKETITRLKDQFLGILGILVENPDIKLSTIETLSNQQKEQFLLDFNEDL